jgi:hypothetical protein
VARRTIVEFTGPPGSGKSELALRCAELLAARGLRVPARPELRSLYMRHGWIGRLAGAQLARDDVAGQRLEYFKEVETPWLLRGFRLRHPRGWRRYRAELAALRAAAPDEAENVERWVEQSVLVFQMLRSQARRMDMFLWEEGIVHRAVNLLVRPGAAPDLARAAAFLRVWAFPDLLVRVLADSSDCAARLAARGGTDRLHGRSASDVLEFVAAADAVAGLAEAEARRRGIPVLRFENRYASREELLAAPACEALAEALAQAARARPRSAA